MNQDLEHLRLLSIFHYVVGSFLAICACFPLIYVALGLVMVFAPPPISEVHQNEQETVQAVGFAIAGVAAVIVLAGWAFAVCVIVAGRNLARQQRYTFCLVMAALLCTFMPFGTILGVFTIIVLSRPSAKALFTHASANPPEDIGQPTR